MIRSMTAYARLETEIKIGNLIWELRSVNHRFLELSFRLPENFRYLEAKFREIIREHLSRGKLEVNLYFQAGAEAGSQVRINEALLASMSAACEQVASCYQRLAPSSAMELLRWPGMVVMENADLSQVEDDIFESFQGVVTQLGEVRQREGEALGQILHDRLQQIISAVETIKGRVPDVISYQRQRLLERFEEAKVELDPTRLEQEMLIFVQKMDVAEELDRLQTHTAEVKRTLQKPGAIGRHLDFLFQEMNREANTIGSKSVDGVVSHQAVDIKVLVEQMREQTQNIE